MWKIKKTEHIRGCGFTEEIIYCEGEYDLEIDVMKKMYELALNELNTANRYEHEIAENYENRYYLYTDNDEHDIVIVKEYHSTGETFDWSYYDLIEVTDRMEVFYVWNHHMNPEVCCKMNEIDIMIENHDWESFKKWLEWEKKQDMEYFPKTIKVGFDDEFEKEIELNEHNFKTITFVENECG